MHSLQGNPQFVNAAAGNFNVKPTSKALAIGFKNFPVNEFGVVTASLKEKAAKPKITAVRTLEAGRKGATTEWLGAVIKNIETLGEQSASGAPDKNGVLVAKVNKGSLAETNGLEAGDVIRKLTEKRLLT